MFDDGDLILEIVPELWLLSSGYSTKLPGEVWASSLDNVTVLRRAE
jgi:hypothetical protein